MCWFYTIEAMLLGMGVGTVALWMFSFTVRTPSNTITVAALYNVIMMVVKGVLLEVDILFPGFGSRVEVVAIPFSSAVTGVMSFWLLLRLYRISVWDTLWLFPVPWLVDKGVEVAITASVLHP